MAHPDFKEARICNEVDSDQEDPPINPSFEEAGKINLPRLPCTWLPLCSVQTPSVQLTRYFWQAFQALWKVHNTDLHGTTFAKSELAQWARILPIISRVANANHIFNFIGRFPPYYSYP
jgi:hypothetical protein